MTSRPTAGPGCAWLAVLGAATLIWLPSLLFGGLGDSYSYDLNWSAQFTRQLLAGDPYPRWTAASFDGLGAPTFYFYPPLPFWGAAAVGAASQGLLSPSLQLKLTELAFLALSGWGMQAWLRTGASRTTAAVGAALFMLAPYHLDDLYLRGAFAEFGAIALVPLVALGLARTAGVSRFGPVLLAAGWGGLVLCHLPMALLTGVLFAGPYALLLVWEARGRRALAALRIAAAFAVGTGLAAAYLLPSLTLQGSISAEYWTSAKFQVAGHLFARPAAWTSVLEPFFGFLSLAEVAIAAVIGWRALRRGDGSQLFWAILVVALFLVMAGLVPGFWSAPLVDKVQFPWRAMGLQDFAFVTLFAWAPKTDRTPAVIMAFAALVAGNAVAVGRDLATLPAARLPGYGATSFPTDADAPEYLPKGLLRMGPDGPALALPYRSLTARPLASGPAVDAASDGGEIRIRLAQGRTGPVIVRRFYFPSWQVACDGRAVQTRPSAGLLGFTPPAGARSCVARIAMLPVERFGDAIGLLSFALLVGYAAWAARRSRSPFAPARSAQPASA